MTSSSGPTGAGDEPSGHLQSDGPATPFRLTLAHPADGGSDTALACTLPSAEALDDRVGEWRAVLAHASRRQDLDDGLSIEFDSDVPVEELMRLVVAEQSCCSFFRFSVHIGGDAVGLDVRADDNALDVVRSLFG